jgi:uncharacterized membrane protein YuzA (DUF378 family)
MNKLSAVDSVVGVILIIGGLNWGLVGALDVNLVTLVLGGMPMLVSSVYVIVGLSAVYMAYKMIKCCMSGCGGDA